MKVTFICPKPTNINMNSVPIFNFPNQAIYLLASITPLNWDVEIIDENKTPINFEAETDLVALTALSASALRAYEIAGKFRMRGIPVIMGGIHATVLPDETAKYVDSVVVGEADEIWSQILNDFERGRLQKAYKPQLPRSLDLQETREITKTHRVNFINWLPLSLKVTFMQVGRGCPNSCEFCSVTKISGRTLRTKSIPYIIGKIKEEIAKGTDFFFFYDDNIIVNKKFAKELFRAIKPLNIKWMSQADIKIADEDILDLAVESGMAGIFLGLESISENTLGDGVGRVKQRMRPNYENAIKRLHDHNVNVMGALIFGFDHESEDSYAETVEWAIQNKLDIGQFTVLTPLPGTDLSERMKREGRITTPNWTDYDCTHDVVRREKTRTKNLDLIVRVAFKKFYSYGAQLRRFRLPKNLFDLAIRLTNMRLRTVTQSF
jgi:radical SAM superfamily enzyme YgiQ (UPF0313 family)